MPQISIFGEFSRSKNSEKILKNLKNQKKFEIFLTFFSRYLSIIVIIYPPHNSIRPNDRVKARKLYFIHDVTAKVTDLPDFNQNHARI